MLKELDNLRLIRQAPENTPNTCITKTLTTNQLQIHIYFFPGWDTVPSSLPHVYSISTILQLDNLISTPPGSYLKLEGFISSLHKLFHPFVNHLRTRFPISRGKRNDPQKNARVGSISFRVPHASEFS